MFTDDSTPKILESFHLSPVRLRLLNQQYYADTVASNNQRGGKSSFSQKPQEGLV